MIIGLDLDGVVADFNTTFIGAYNEWFDAHLEPEEFVDYSHIIEGTHFVDHDHLYQWTAQVPGFWESLRPIPGFAAGVAELSLMGHQIIVITARPEAAHHGTKVWLRDHWPVWQNFPSNLPPVSYTDKKWQIPAQIYVDDSPDVIRSLVERQAPVIRFAQPYNKGVKASAGVANNWTELTKMLLEMGEVLAA